MNNPNFFIIGAPKCGTTSLSKWLMVHPNIFMPKVKEPHYFYTDGNSQFRRTTVWHTYLSHFKEATSDHFAVGEASVFYLFSKEAVNNILSHFPEAKFIVMLRNPVEMAISLHWQEVYSENEDVIDFEKAWLIQEKRSKGFMVPEKCKEPKHLIYSEVCKLGRQIERLLTLTSRTNVHLIFFDDIISNPNNTFKSALRYLGVSDDFSVEFATHNKAKSVRYKFLRRLIEKVEFLKNFIGIDHNTGLLKPLCRFNTIYGTKPHVKTAFKVKLREYFREDIEKLEKITGRNLSNWYLR